MPSTMRSLLSQGGPAVVMRPSHYTEIDERGGGLRAWATFLDTAPRLTDLDNDRWIGGGVLYNPIGEIDLDDAVTVSLANDCEAPVEVAERVAPDGVAFCPVELAVSSRCSTISDWDKMRTQDRAVLEAAQGAELYRALLFGGGEAGTEIDPEETCSPALLASATTLSSGAMPMDQALALIEQGMANVLANRLGLIHMTPAALLFLSQRGMLIFDNGAWKTPTGHSIIADAGNLGWQPTGEIGGAGEEWIYGSGPVYWQLSEVIDPGESQDAFLMSSNQVLTYLKRFGVAVFDPDTVVAAQSEYVLS